MYEDCAKVCQPREVNLRWFDCCARGRASKDKVPRHLEPQMPHRAVRRSHELPINSKSVAQQNLINSKSIAQQSPNRFDF